MPENRKTRFFLRRFITFHVVISFLVMIITGLVLYVTPPGRVAHWTNWTLLGLSKGQWQSIHTIVTFIFIAAASLHLYYNWRVLMAYIKTKMHSGIKSRRELSAALLVNAIIITGTLYYLPPFSTVMDFGEQLSASWEENTPRAPVSRAERLSIAELAGTVRIPVDTLLSRISALGVEGVLAETTVEVAAARAGYSPSDFYQKLVTRNRKQNIAEESYAAATGKNAAATGTNPAATGRNAAATGRNAAATDRNATATGNNDNLRNPVTGGQNRGSGGYGRKNISQLCQELDIDVKAGIKKLDKHGIEASGESNIRELAMNNNMRPIEIVNILKL